MSANSLNLLVPKYARLGEGFSKKEIAEAALHPGRRTTPRGYQSRASWIGDLTALKKCIVLCRFCRVNFNHRKHHYRKLFIADPTGKTDGYQASGICDACKEQTVNCGGGTAFVHEETHQQVCIDPVDARRRARAASRAVPVSFFLRRN